MPKKNSYITVTDQFCGAGGSSQGAYAAGAEVKLAMNHWKLAIETHNTNFPETAHDCTDISACDPRRYPSSDILITSPECTNHSLAKGQKQVKSQLDMFDKGVLDAAAERSRATMWDVARFAEYHQYNCIVVENVVDARKWIMWESWLHAMHSLGYKHRCIYLNSMHCHPTPQSRDRMYVVFWKKGNKEPMLDYTPNAYCQKCGKDVNAVQTWKNHQKQFGKYKQQYVYCCPNDGSIVEPYYHAAFNCIDWTDIGQRIGDREKPLSPNTVSRINYGIDKYGTKPMILHALYSNQARGVIRPVEQPSFTQTTMPTQAIMTPFIIKLEHSQRSNNVVACTEELSTQTNRQSSMLITNVRSAGEPLQTQTTTQGMGFVTAPMIIENKKTSKAREATKPIACITGTGYHGILTDQSWNSFIANYYNGSHCTKHITEELGTVTTGDRSLLVNYNKPNIEDCYYRMLKAPEVKLAMAFRPNYIVLGNSKDQVKQLGNAVTPPAMEWIIKQVIQSLN